MRLNNRGFTFVEILAVIVLIGVLSSIAIVGVSRYRENAKNKDYEALAKASYNAMEEYMMKNPYKKKVSLKTLDNDDFLSNRTDPGTKSTDCSGSVEVNTTTEGTNGVMDENEYTVYLCCTNYKKKYTYPTGDIDDYNGTNKCDVEEDEEDETPIPGPLPGETEIFTITYNLNGGTVSGNPDKYAESMLPFTLKKPRKTGYVFTGWTGSNGTTPEVNLTLPKNTKGDKTYTANWKENECTINYTSAGGKFNKNTNKTKLVIKYGESKSLSNPIDYFSATRKWFIADSSSAWIDNRNNTYKAGNSYTALQMCGNNLKDENVSVTLKVNWRRTKIAIEYYTNGATLTPSELCDCPIPAGCKKNECNRKTDLPGCTGRKKGHVYTSTHTNDYTGWSTKGMADYASPNKSTIYLLKGGKRGDGDWRIGSANSTKKISQKTKFGTGQDLAKACGKSYYNMLMNKDITIKAYAGGF